METEVTVSCLRSLFTITDFKRKGGETIRLKVGVHNAFGVSSSGTYYHYYLYVKGFKCRNYEFKYQSTMPVDERYKEYITEQELYDAFYNHWVQINPLRIFSRGSVNGVTTEFTVVGKSPSSTEIGTLRSTYTPSRGPR